MFAAAVWTVSELLIYQYRSSQTPRLYRGTCFNNFLEKTLKQDAKKFHRFCLRVELLLLHIKRSQSRWFGHLTRKPKDASWIPASEVL